MMPIRRNYNQNWLPSIFNDFFDNDWMEKANATAPAINVVENDNSYKIEVAAPGMTKEDFNIHLTEDNQLVISMEKKNETKDEKKKYLRLDSQLPGKQPARRRLCRTDHAPLPEDDPPLFLLRPPALHPGSRDSLLDAPHLYGRRISDRIRHPFALGFQQQCQTSASSFRG